MLIVFLSTTYLYSHNVSQQDDMAHRLYEATEPLLFQVNQKDKELDEKKINHQLDEIGSEQSTYIKNMKNALFQWRSAIHAEEFHDVPNFEQEFLENLKEYINTGGEFQVLDGIDLEYAFIKNQWMIKHDLAIENEENPISPHLFLKDVSDWLFGISGIVLLLLIFGNILSSEREQETWRTLKTQPISQSQMILSKFSVLLFVLFFYIIIVLAIGVLLPILFNDHPFEFIYPQMMLSEDEVFAISTLHYILFKILLFVGTGFISFSLLFLFSTLFKQTFNSLIVSLFTLLIGYYTTHLVSAIQTPLNLFQHLRFNQTIIEINQSHGWTYPLFASLWTLIFLTTTLLIPERKTKPIKTESNIKPFNSGDTNSKRGILLNVIIFV